ncbi:MAG: hypothetical protein K0R63_946 [Rickettsiales bacterium]|jgi:hypothetical protein|nr:hypothetical protein [Rickettsiales bacterium]
MSKSSDKSYIVIGVKAKPTDSLSYVEEKTRSISKSSTVEACASYYFEPSPSSIMAQAQSTSLSSSSYQERVSKKKRQITSPESNDESWLVRSVEHMKRYGICPPIAMSKNEKRIFEKINEESQYYQSFTGITAVRTLLDGKVLPNNVRNPIELEVRFDSFASTKEFGQFVANCRFDGGNIPEIKGKSVFIPYTAIQDVLDALRVESGTAHYPLSEMLRDELVESQKGKNPSTERSSVSRF